MSHILWNIAVNDAAMQTRESK